MVVIGSRYLPYSNYVISYDYLITRAYCIWIREICFPISYSIFPVNLFNTTLNFYCFMGKWGICGILLSLRPPSSPTMFSAIASESFVGLLFEVVYGTLYDNLCLRWSCPVISRLRNQVCEWWVSCEALCSILPLV